MWQHDPKDSDEVLVYVNKTVNCAMKREPTTPPSNLFQSKKTNWIVNLVESSPKNHLGTV